MADPTLTPAVSAVQTLGVPPSSALFPSATTFPGASTLTVAVPGLALVAAAASSVTLTPA